MSKCRSKKNGFMSNGLALSSGEVKNQRNAAMKKDIRSRSGISSRYRQLAVIFQAMVASRVRHARSFKSNICLTTCVALAVLPRCAMVEAQLLPCKRRAPPVEAEAAYPLAPPNPADALSMAAPAPRVSPWQEGTWSWQISLDCSLQGGDGRNRTVNAPSALQISDPALARTISTGNQLERQFRI
jgi:hypothetical protein